ncbi:nucleotide exchange factor GrpE [Candidatus Parcubacteria bacterium]|nr:MAG: nucleotide exchange factor GrpE [Candidatus Parcubacteria bacterium]
MEKEKKYPRLVVSAFIFNDKEELLLVRHPRWNNQYIIPGGKVEYNENLEAAVIREVKEETNLDVVDIEFLKITERPNLGDKYLKDDKHLVSVQYLTKVKNEKKFKESDEAKDPKWLKPQEWLNEKEVEESVIEVIKTKLIDRSSFEDMYKRALADYQNLLKQSAKEKQDFVKFANEQMLYELIPVFDNLKLAIKHADDEAQKNPWFAGVVHVTKQFEDVLSSIGLVELKAENEKFDHNTMEALEKEETDDKKKDGLVSKVVKPGYKLKDKVISHTKVVVYEYKK